MARIISIIFDRNDHLIRATIRTRLGTVKVRWMDVAGDHCWRSLLEDQRDSRCEEAGRASYRTH